MAHTPGPWNIRYAQDRADAFIEFGDRSNITDKEARLVAQCFMHDFEDEANARLIAAAPDLLEALRKLLIDAGEGGKRGRAIDLLPKETIDEARAAIAKAEGTR